MCSSDLALDSGPPGLVPAVRQHPGDLPRHGVHGVVGAGVDDPADHHGRHPRRIRANPPGSDQAALALGATRWEMIRMTVLPHGRSGATAAAMLGLGRALGETIAVMLILSASEAFYMMKEIGLMSEILPEIEALYGLRQPEKYHNDGVFDHTFKVLDRTNSDLLLRTAALLHDAGKLKACKNEEGKISFYGHEIYGAEIAGNILKRLRYPKEFARKTVNIIRNHMRPKNYNRRWKDSSLRRFAADCGEETDYVLELAKADYGKDAADKNVFEFSERLENLNKKGLLYPKEELVSGGELMEYFAMTGGDWIKKAKKCIAEARFENPALTKDEALRLVKEMLNKSRDRKAHV